MNGRKLHLDALRVESFETTPVPAARGTVEAREYTGVDECVYATPSCEPGQTQGAHSCHCLYPRTDPFHICCNSDYWCSNGCGTATCQCGTGNCTATCQCETAGDMLC